MKAIIQRVKSAEVRVESKEAGLSEPTGIIESGLLVYLGIGKNDTQKYVDYMVNKISNLRIFEDDEGKMNYSLLDKKYEILVVSQFTLYGDAKKGSRPNFQEAAEPEKAHALYEEVINKLSELELRVKSGVFQAMMEVESVNDGPVTIILES
jgi:D-tyrosyl-tRNA(Tyr) deacylase